MDSGKRFLVLCLSSASAIAMISACSTPSPPPPPTSTTLPPIMAPALDVSRYLADPCSGVPTELTTQLGLSTRTNAHETKLVDGGEQAECLLTSGPSLTVQAEVRFYPEARPVPKVAGWANMKPTTVAGYPAAEWIPGAGKDGDYTLCQFYVDIAETQGLNTVYSGLAGQTIETACANAKQLAEGVLAAIPR